MNKFSIHINKKRITTLFILICLAHSIWSPIPSYAEQEMSPFDWRKNLHCPEQYQTHQGLLYCTGTDETGGVVHVIVVDLSSPDIHFEYVIPHGASKGYDGVNECRDPNIPLYGGPYGGCYVLGNEYIYPQLRIQDAVLIAADLYSSLPLTAVINADYTGYDGSHGPEGLIVIRGERLDGVSNCDDDYNAVLRPWLGIGSSLEPDMKLLPATIDRLTNDMSSLPGWIHTGIGGGPWLVRDGEIYAGAMTCVGDRTISNPTPVTNCSSEQKSTPLQVEEGYSSGSCRAAPHTAAGASQDGQWLFLALSTSWQHPDVLARFMKNKLGAWDALKFDGGGSSQLWVQGNSETPIDPSGENRRLSSYLAVYSQEGDGIYLPLNAQLQNSFAIKMLSDEEISFSATNIGPFTWLPEDGVTLLVDQIPNNKNNQKAIPLDEAIAPGGTVSFVMRLSEFNPGLWQLQMSQKDAPFGKKSTLLIVGLPEAITQIPQNIETAFEAVGDYFDQLRKTLELKITEIINKIIDDAKQEIENRLISEINELIKDLGLETCCASVWVALIPVGMLVTAALGKKKGNRDDN